ncbi:MBL fold metallo-hydrolase [Bacteroides sp. 519]|uniref:MBL fold metallo-hydrolase n=1 Tax=Bacteroides sp. 519 TaxID=2302937 RepID=UPI0013CFF0F1|nr:MBL fold metallo-hydrolase [Bacteroides sp. 519]NDV57763.1 MBL fold metallo-hydrolase [Bacteroides sp. 519]
MKRFKNITIHLYILLGSIFVLSGCSVIRSIGKYPSKKREAEFAQLPNYKNRSFQNIYNTDTIMYLNNRVPQEVKMRQFRKRPKLSQDIPSVKTNLLDTVFPETTIVWFGHSSYLIQSKGFNILVDPVLSGYASPLFYFNRSMPGSHIYKPKDLPAIDLIVITHDHYDHLDCSTIRKYKKKKETKAIVPLGVGTLLSYWNWKPERYREVNWGDTVEVATGIRIISTPVQHRSGRWTKKNRTLWSSYVLEIHGHKIFIGGDSGYNKHFKDIGDMYGPFDLAILENAQYSTEWPKNHSFPEQTVHTVQELKARMVLPVHWARYAASYHIWNEPIKELVPLMDTICVPITVPRIGEPYTIGDTPKREIWWDFE